MLDRYDNHWALVTGASSGIGAEFAARLAGRGMHLVLAARRTDRMNTLAEELVAQHGIKCHIVTIDLSELNAADRLKEEIDKQGIEIELLVNNAGVGLIGDLETTSPDDVQRLINLNISTLSRLTYHYLPDMLERGHGAIINVSSVAAFQPVAFMAAYAASKSFVLHFSEALWAEARSRGVTVMALCPGVTDTEFFDKAGAPGWLQKHSFQTPFRVVKVAMRALEKRRQYVVPGWKDYLVSLLVRLATRRTSVNESKRYFRPKQREKARAASESTTTPPDTIE